MILQDINNLHHAYLIEGDPKSVATEIISFLEESGVRCLGNPNVCQEFFETFSIDDSRALKNLSVEKATEDKKKFFILGSNFFNREALNALLKLFEEPTKDTHFFLITPNPHLIIDTLRSRMAFIERRDDDRGVDTEIAKEAETFLKSDKKKRIEQIEKFIKKYKDIEVLPRSDLKGAPADAKALAGRQGPTLKSASLKFLNAIEKTLRGLTSKGLFEFEEIGKVRKYLFDRGASIKMLLEHLALILP